MPRWRCQRSAGWRGTTVADETYGKVANTQSNNNWGDCLSEISWKVKDQVVKYLPIKVQFIFWYIGRVPHWWWARAVCWCSSVYKISKVRIQECVFLLDSGFINFIKRKACLPHRVTSKRIYILTMSCKLFGRMLKLQTAPSGFAHCTNVKACPTARVVTHSPEYSVPVDDTTILCQRDNWASFRHQKIRRRYRSTTTTRALFHKA